MLGVISIILQTSLILLASGYFLSRLLRREDARWVLERMLPIMIGLYAFAMLVPNRWVVYVVLVAIIPVLARNRSDIPSLFVVAALSMPSLATPVGIGGIYLLSFDKWLMLGIGTAIAFFIRRPVPGDLMPSRFDIPFLLIMMLEALQARGDNFTSILRLETNILLSYMLPYFTISRSITRPEHFRRLLLALVLSAFCLSAIGIYEARRGVLLYNMLSSRLGIAETISSYSHLRGGALRATGPFGDATSFGGFLCTALLALMALTDIFRKKRFWWIAAFVIFAGIMAANTRAALLGLGVGVLAFNLFKREYGKVARNVALIGIAYVGALIAARFSDGIATRIGRAGDSVGTSDYRLRLLTRGWEEIRKHPLFGVTPDQAYASLIDLKQGEGFVDFVNAYIWFGLTTGVIGMVALLLGLLLMPAKLMTIRRRLRRLPNGQEFGAIVFAVSIYFAVAAGTSGFGGRGGMIFYIVLAGGAALAAMRAPRPSSSLAQTAPAAQGKPSIEPNPAAPILARQT